MHRANPSRPFVILLVEDSPDDADLMARALKEGTLDPDILIVDDGEKALDYLRRQGDYRNAPAPDLILLDLHLPRMNGFEVLDAIKTDARLTRIPVVLLTSSENENVIPDAYDHRANCCVMKPADQEEFTRAVKRIEHFWLTIARRGHRDGP